MSKRHEAPKTVRPERVLSRAGIWTTKPQQLELPFTASGLSERITASGRLKVTPDYDVLAWLCERWQTQPTKSGWMKPTLYEIGSALYGKAPSGENYREISAALARLAMVSVTITGYDAETGTFRDDWEMLGLGILDLGTPRDAPGALDRPSIMLDGWLRTALDAGQVVRLPWGILRRFDRNQQLAKRLWIYLQAERFKPTGRTEAGMPTEAAWVVCGDRLEAALGMDYDRPRDARAAIARACEAVKRVDDRYLAGALCLESQGRGRTAKHRVWAERPTWEAWREHAPEWAATRPARENLRRELANPRTQ